MICKNRSIFIYKRITKKKEEEKKNVSKKIDNVLCTMKQFIYSILCSIKKEDKRTRSDMIYRFWLIVIKSIIIFLFLFYRYKTKFFSETRIEDD